MSRASRLLFRRFSGFLGLAIRCPSCRVRGILRTDGGFALLVSLSGLFGTKRIRVTRTQALLPSAKNLLWRRPSQSLARSSSFAQLAQTPRPPPPPAQSLVSPRRRVAWRQSSSRGSESPVSRHPGEAEAAPDVEISATRNETEFVKAETIVMPPSYSCSATRRSKMRCAV